MASLPLALSSVPPELEHTRTHCKNHPATRVQPQPVDDVEANVASTEVDRDAAPIMYCKLPDDIQQRHVLLLDPILPGGYSAVRAIEALLVRACGQARAARVHAVRSA